MPDGPVSRPWRSYTRFSVRVLIVLVLAIGAGLGWLVRSARIQCEAVAAIERADGWVEYDWDWKDGQPIKDGWPLAPSWLVHALGVDYFGRVVAVRWSGDASGADIAHV